MTAVLYARCLSSTISEDTFFYWLPYLSETMQVQIKKYRKKEDAYLSLAGKVLLYKVLRQQGMSESILSQIRYTDFRRPFIPNSDIDFNIAHSEEFVVVTYTQSGRVGIDLERMIPVKPGDFKSQMSLIEWQEIEGAEDPQTAFYTYWTQKEAVLKANGKGMYIPLQSFQIQSGRAYLEEETWSLQEIQIANGYKCHLATSQEQSVEIYDLTREIWKID